MPLAELESDIQRRSSDIPLGKGQRKRKRKTPYSESSSEEETESHLNMPMTEPRKKKLICPIPETLTQRSSVITQASNKNMPKTQHVKPAEGLKSRIEHTSQLRTISDSESEYNFSRNHIIISLILNIKSSNRWRLFCNCFFFLPMCYFCLVLVLVTALTMYHGIYDYSTWLCNWPLGLLSQ